MAFDVSSIPLLRLLLMFIVISIFSLARYASEQLFTRPNSTKWKVIKYLSYAAGIGIMLARAFMTSDEKMIIGLLILLVYYYKPNPQKHPQLAARWRKLKSIMNIVLGITVAIWIIMRLFQSLS